MENDVRVLSLNEEFKEMERGVSDAAYFFLESLDEQGKELEIYLVNDVRMGEINHERRGRSSSTNVLALGTPEDFPHPDSELMHIGEIYLSPEYISNHEEDIYYMLLHGILHP